MQSHKESDEIPRFNDLDSRFVKIFEEMTMTNVEEFFLSSDLVEEPKHQRVLRRSAKAKRSLEKPHAIPLGSELETTQPVKGDVKNQ